ncbi:MAG: RIP metalloprotease RseP [Candidatus Melainabacteria bacterium RIFCSPHIGHO2_02_FULL_34_12]|nr:MAG: RIP metalloprotease RseP [Candidatus Melainabacteria bacterium RIFCSPHIGHO2_02_FULL_34_12]
MIVLNLIVVLGLISLMIIVHEFGHWIVARRLGFQTPIFGFGLPFGSHIKIGNWKNTEFRFHWFVLGGYVAIPELGDESSEELLKEMPNLKSLKTFPVWKRACVASAGVIFNILFAYLMCLIMVATIGPPSSKGNVVITGLLDSTSIAKEHGIVPNPIAKQAGLRAGDVVLKVNHLKIKDPTRVVQIVKSHPLKEVLFKIQRKTFKNGKPVIKTFNVKVIPNKEGAIGIGLGLIKNGEYEKPSRNPFVWLGQSGVILIEWTVSMLIGLWLMITNMFGLSPAGAPKIGTDDLHGIIAIVSIFAQAITVDFREIYRWSALISVNLAIINLLPIPALDGGHLLFMVIEKIRGKRLAESIQQRAIQTGFFLLLLLMFFVLFNDIKGLISGKFNLMPEEKSSGKKD